MAVQRGKDTFLSINGKDLSPFTTDSELNRTAGADDVTGYGSDDEVWDGTIRGGKLTASGKYDTSVANGPRGVLRPLIRETVTYIRRGEGTGSGKPQDTGSAVLLSFVETNPVAGHVLWSAEFQLSGPVNSTAQP